MNTSDSELETALAAAVADLAAETEADRGPGWTQANECRPSIAQQLGIPAAIWTHRQKSAKATAIDARRFKRAVDAIEKLPQTGEVLHIVTGQEFAGFDLLGAMLRLADATGFEALTLTALGFSKANLTALAGMLESGALQAGTLRILCSDFFRRADKALWQIGAEQARRLGYGFRSTRNHTKLILGAIAGNYFVVESSANLRSCANLEQFTITPSRELFEFHQGWINQVWQIAEE
jgi:hypothetical protein